MSRFEKNAIVQLPLSWARLNLAEPLFTVVNLPYSSPSWIPLAKIPHHLSFDQIYQQHLKKLPQGFVLQSCNLAIRDYLLEQGCQVAPMGAEAILDLPWRGKRSVRELARRGMRHGMVREIELTPGNQRMLHRLMKASPSRQGLQLQYTERSDFDAATRCFVFETAAANWFGAITFSTPAPNYVHTEQLLRHEEAPVGIMEAIITTMAQKLAQEGVQQLSLGNVAPLSPAESDTLFSRFRHPEEVWTRSQLAFRLGRALNFAYNAEGLWRFKNKFSPRWEPLYLCASPSLSWATIAGLAQATGYLNMVKTRLLELSPFSLPTRPLPVHLRDIFKTVRFG